MSAFDPRSSFEEARATLDAFLADPAALDGVRAFAAAAEETLRGGGLLMSCGNGGSMCDAMHFAEEWTGRFRGNRGALAALAFSDPSHLNRDGARALSRAIAGTPTIPWPTPAPPQ